MRVDPLRFAVLFPALWAAHAVGDHVVQTDAQAAGKPESWGAMARHVGGYQATQLGAVIAIAKSTGLRLAPGPLAVGSIFSTVTHAFLDRRWPVTGLLRRTGSGRFARGTVVVPPVIVRPGAIHDELWTTDNEVPLPLHGTYLADQALHTACLLVSAALMAVRRR